MWATASMKVSKSKQTQGTTESHLCYTKKPTSASSSAIVQGPPGPASCPASTPRRQADLKQARARQQADTTAGQATHQAAIKIQKKHTSGRRRRRERREEAAEPKRAERARKRTATFLTASSRVNRAELKPHSQANQRERKATRAKPTPEHDSAAHVLLRRQNRAQAPSTLESHGRKVVSREQRRHPLHPATASQAPRERKQKQPPAAPSRHQPIASAIDASRSSAKNTNREKKSQIFLLDSSIDTKSVISDEFQPTSASSSAIVQGPPGPASCSAPPTPVAPRLKYQQQIILKSSYRSSHVYQPYE